MKRKNRDRVKESNANKVQIIRKDDTPRNKKFEKLCLKDQKELKRYLIDYFNQQGKKVIAEKGFIYIEGDTPVLLSAHLDTVHAELPKEIVYESGAISSPQGIGGDDRCGVYAIIEILKELDCHVVFCEDEEIGGAGSEIFAETELCTYLGDKVNYVIDLDRMGNNDAVYYYQDNWKFEKFIEKEFWKMNYGSFTDICNICPTMKVSGVNLSVGYYKQHTLSEYVVLSEMEKAIEEVKKLIRRTEENVRFEYVEEINRYSGYGSFWNSGYWNNESWFGSSGHTSSSKKIYKEEDCFYIVYFKTDRHEVEFIEAASETEAIGSFLMDNPDMAYNDIVDHGYFEDYEYNYGTEEDDNYWADIIQG